LISEGKPLRDEDILQELPVGTTATFYFKDLGSQMTWGTVSVLTYTQTSKYNHIQHCFSFSTCVDSKIQRPQKIFRYFCCDDNGAVRLS